MRIRDLLQLLLRKVRRDQNFRFFSCLIFSLLAIKYREPFKPNRVYQLAQNYPKLPGKKGPLSFLLFSKLKLIPLRFFEHITLMKIFEKPL